MIRAVIVGQEGVIVHFKETPPRVYGEVRRAVREETIHLVRQGKLKVSGPVLKVKSDKLRGGINPEFTETESEITGSAGINAGKARYPAVHEYGGTVTVREHIRKLTQVFGRKLDTVRTVTVRAHSATYPERSYLRSALRENAARIQGNIRAAVARGIKG